MAEAATEILSSPERWDSMSRAGRAAAEERFGAAKVVPVYERFYGEVMAGGTEPGKVPDPRESGPRRVGEKRA
jgi:hypothetical protein